MVAMFTSRSSVHFRKGHFSSLLRITFSVFLGALVAGCGPPEVHMPDQALLEDGWNTLRPGGATACVDDEDYRFFVRPGSTDRLFVYFEGGGACWDAETCRLDSGVYDPGIDFDPATADGAFDLDRTENPLRDYSMVVIPYCTGDVHLGRRDTTYRFDEVSEPLLVRHRGQINAQVVLDWTYGNFGAPEQVFVSGSSAGAVATPIYADQIARRYPEARVVGLGDGAGGYRSTAVSGADLGRWGVPEVLQSLPGWEDFEATTLGLETLYLHAGQRTGSNLELYLFDQAYDVAQRRYVELAGGGDADLLELIRMNQRDLAQSIPSFRSFVVGGFEHTVMPRAGFYFYKADGVRFDTWLADILSGTPVSSVTCTDCDRPSFDYTDADLAVIDRMLELLSTEDDWDSDHEGECPWWSGQLSLRCAMFEAADQIGSVPAPSYPAIWDILYTTAERLEDHDAALERPHVRFNNDDATELDDIRAVLMEVRSRIQSHLAAVPAAVPSVHASSGS